MTGGLAWTRCLWALIGTTVRFFWEGSLHQRCSLSLYRAGTLSDGAGAGQAARDHVAADGLVDHTRLMQGTQARRVQGSEPREPRGEQDQATGLGQAATRSTPLLAVQALGCLSQRRLFWSSPLPGQVCLVQEALCRARCHLTGHLPMCKGVVPDSTRRERTSASVESGLPGTEARQALPDQ